MDLGFLGRGWSFPPRFDPRTRGLVMAEGAEDIGESLSLLLSTRPGERVLQPGYGCDLRPYVFEIPDDSTLMGIREAVRRAVLFYEPRVELLRVDADLREADKGLLLLGLDYSVRATNTRHNLVYPFYLKQATNPVAGSKP